MNYLMNNQNEANESNVSIICDEEEEDEEEDEEERKYLDKIYPLPKQHDYIIHDDEEEYPFTSAFDIKTSTS